MAPAALQQLAAPLLPAALTRVACRRVVPRAWHSCHAQRSCASSAGPAGRDTKVLLEELLAENKAQREQLARLTVDVEALTSIVKTAECANARNLMVRQAMEEESDQIPSRESFQPKWHMVGNQPTRPSQVDSITLAHLALMGNAAAQQEQLIREVMYVDNVCWEKAHVRLREMDEYNEKYYWLYTLPHRIGISLAVLGAIGGSLMVFSKPVANFYGTKVAGEDLPEGHEDIQELTTNQVGAWTWNWMEPMIGTASFVLLCMQFTRTLACKLHMRPYTEAMQRWRATRLADRYTQYDRSVVRNWAKHLPVNNHAFFPVYRRYFDPWS